MNAIDSVAPVAVAVSGGADSLYTMVRLKEQGNKVIALHGVFFPPRDREMEEKRAVALERLQASCSALEVPLTVIDFSSRFSELVILPFVSEYARGRTPNPCALCNARIKFGLLLDAAHGLGASRLATGHYARLETEARPDGSALPALLQGADQLKDQSYFLALVPPERLARALFPLGGATKSQVLQTLRDRGMEVPIPGESQEVCFVPDDEYRFFLPQMAEQHGVALPGPGPMLLGDGRRIGTHRGLWQYTEGQRKGLGIAWKEPLHVLAKETKSNTLRLGPREEMRVEGVCCEDINVLLPPERWPDTVWVKTRYRERPKPATAKVLPPDGRGLPGMRIRFLEPDNSVAPGQIAAVYVPWKGEARLSAATDESGDEKRPLRVAAGAIIHSRL